MIYPAVIYLFNSVICLSLESYLCELIEFTSKLTSTQQAYYFDYHDLSRAIETL